MQEDLGVTLKLPRSAGSPVFRAIAAFPAGVLALSLAMSCLATLWLASSSARLFSVSDELFTHASHPDCRLYSAIQREISGNTAARQIRAWQDANQGRTLSSADVALAAGVSIFYLSIYLYLSISLSIHASIFYLSIYIRSLSHTRANPLFNLSVQGSDQPVAAQL